MANKRKLEIRYTDDDGKEQIYILTDVDEDRKPEIFIQHPNIFGEKRSFGPHESPVAIPDFMELLAPLLSRAMPQALASFFGIK